MNINNQNPELLEKIRQQFNFAPYPNKPLEQLPTPRELYIHSLTTAYYVRNHQVIDSKNKIILDAGCGSGYKSFILAMANPEAKIIGIDISEKSLELASKRFEYYGLKNGEFRLCTIEDISKLGIIFDYINCDQVLSLLRDPVNILKSLKSVLNKKGIIRANFHSLLQRFKYFQAQKLFSLMGLMNDNPEDLEVDIVFETMESLKDDVYLKKNSWYLEEVNKRKTEAILMNYLLKGDQGYQINDLFSFLREANLEFINMVNWQQWDLLDLFKEPDNLPVFWGMSIPEMTVEQKLSIYELFNPVNRLLDFYCGHPGETLPYIPVSEWEQSHWEKAIVHLHPQLKTEETKINMTNSIYQLQKFNFSDLVPGQSVELDHHIIATLLPLFDSAKPFDWLMEHYQKIYPYNPITLEAITDQDVFNILSDAFLNLESCGYILLEYQQ